LSSRGIAVASTIFRQFAEPRILKREWDLVNHQILALSPEMVAELQIMAAQDNPSLSRHARIVLARNEGQLLSEIGLMLDVDRATVRRWLKRFEQHGVRGLVHASTGRSRKRRFDDSVRTAVARVALDSPAAAGEAFTHWSLRRLRAHVMARHIIDEVSVEGLRQLLHGVSLPVALWRRSDSPIGRLGAEAQRELEALAQEAGPGISRRARMVLERSGGASEGQIAASFSVSRSCVRRWLTRFGQRGIQGLQVMRRPAHPLVFTRDIRSAIVRCASMDPRDLGFKRPRWSLRTLRTALIRQAVVQRISIQHLGRILGEAGVSLRNGSSVPAPQSA
jgi:putative transposase